jgi:hypothetical protein
VILQESSNEWESLPSERRILNKKEGARIEKKKRGETSVEKLHVLRKEKKRG